MVLAERANGGMRRWNNRTVWRHSAEDGNGPSPVERAGGWKNTATWFFLVKKSEEKERKNRKNGRTPASVS